MSKSAATKQNDMNGVAEETAVLSPYRLIKPKQAASGDTTTESGSIRQNQLVHSVIEKAFAKDSANSAATCNGVPAAEQAAATDVCANQSAASPDSTSAVVTASSMANVVFLNASSSAKGVGAEPLKSPKLCVLNGNVLKVKSDNVSFVCAPANGAGGGLVKKVFSGGERAMNGAGGADNGDADRPKAGNAVPAYIQLAHPSARGNASKFAYTMPATFVTKRTASGGYELLRTKLLENAVAGAPAEQLAQTVRGKGGQATSKKEQRPDSPSVAEARNELVRCRKALIAAAMHPQLPIYTPPPHYSGATYPCEECEDAFTSPQGLTNHKNRRSVLLTYACPVCRKTYEFYNRCTFLLHTRSHDDVTIKACHLTISIIPANKLNFTVLDYDRLRSDTDPTSVLEGCAPTAASERRSSAVAETVPSRSPLLSDVTPKPAKRKASSPAVESVDDSILVCDDDSPPARKETPVSSTDEVTVIDVSESPTKDAAEATPAATRTSTAARKRRLLNSVVNPSGVDKSTTCATTATTSTASTTCGAAVESSAPREVGRQHVVVVPVYPKGGSAASAVSTLDEIYLTSSDEDEDADAQNGEPQQPVTCRECKREVPNLTSHYRAANRPRKEYPCDECNFFNPSACALAAHVRMHRHSPPFICPDCGFYFGAIESFLVHVQQVCFYTHRRIRFRCPECSLLKPTWQLFYEHLRRCHIRQVFRCNVCITSSYSVQVVERHMDRLHPEAKRIIHEGHRCLLCPNMLINKQGVTEHIKKHTLDPQYLRYIYMCQYCNKYACSRMSKFEAHFDVCPERASAEEKTAARKKTPARRSPKSRAQSVEVDSPPCGTPQPVEKDPLSVEKDPLFVEKDPLYVEKDPPPVEKDPLSMEDWEADKLKAEFVPQTKLCIMCRTTKLTGPSKSLFCSACVSFVNADGGVSPMEAPKGRAEGAAGRSMRKIKCKWCKQLLSRDWSVITLHYLHQHLADFDIGLPSRLTKEHAASAGGGASRKRKTSTKQEPPVVTGPAAAAAATASSCRSVAGATAATRSGTSVSTPTVVSVASLAKAQKVGCQYRCVKCGFGTNVRNGFHEHIVAHKMQSNTNYQCLECGECFIVKPSLEKHLIVVHKVRDVGEYYKENKMADSDADSDDGSKEKAVAENQCEVCYMECDSKQQYDRHMRTHGMAFVAMQSRAKS